MKTLLMSLICTFTCLSLFAQDSTNNTNNTNPTTVTPQTTVPMNNNVSDSSSNMNSTNNSNMNSNNSNMNSTNNSNTNSMNSSNMNSMNNKMDSSAMTNTVGQANYAALPVLETYVPDNIVTNVKQAHEGSYIYDITAVKAPMDSTRSQGNSMNQNPTAMNSTTTTTTNSINGTDSLNQNTTTTNTTASTNSNTMGQNSNNMSTPQEYDYVVRYLQGGTMTTEMLDNNGTKVNNP